MGTLSKLDWDLVSARVNAAASNHRLRSMSAGMLWLVLGQYFPGQETAFQEIITDGPDDRGVDAIHVIGDEDSCTVFIFQSKYRDRIEATAKTVNLDDVLKTTSFVSDLVNKSEDLRRCGNLRLREAVEQIWKLHELGTYCSYQVVFASNDQGLHAAARATLESFMEQYPQVRYEQYTARDLIRDMSRSRASPENGQLQVVSREIFERADGDVRGLVASVDARSFIDLITHVDGASVKRHLFDDNLRIFLGVNSGFNSRIVDTATSQDSHLFWYLNNGITITCKNFSYNKGHPNPKIRLEDFQIVNGAQTSHSLVEAAGRNPVALENVVLSVRVYATEREDIAEMVAVATNSQARIHGRDLRSNHPVLKKLEIAFLEHGLFFERKRNMHADKEAALRIDALKLGQIILSFYLREPDSARTSSDTIFDIRFHQIFNDERDVAELINVAKLYGIIERARDDVINQYGDHIESSGDLQYLVYGHWYILFAARLLLAKDGAPVPIDDEAQTLVGRAISIVARACDQTKHVAHYQMFRSPKTKEKIAAEISGKQLELFV